MGIVYVSLAAFAGGIASAILGWLDSGEVFAGRKFAASVLRAFVAGLVFAVGYTLSGKVTVMDIIIAFVAGAGVDVLGNRLAGSIRG